MVHLGRVTPPTWLAILLAIGLRLNDPELVIPYHVKICHGLQDLPAYHAIGQNDFSIAVVAGSFGFPLLTKNFRHVKHVKDLRVEALLGE